MAPAYSPDMQTILDSHQAANRTAKAAVALQDRQLTSSYEKESSLSAGATQLPNVAKPIQELVLAAGTKHKSPVKKDKQVTELRRICDEVLSELVELEASLCNADEIAGPAAEMINHMDRLYALPFGEKDDESLKRVAVAIKSQIVNVEWTRDLCEFLREATKLLRVRWVIGEDTLDSIHDLMDAKGLNSLRGTLGDTGFIRRYKLVEVID